MGSYYFKTTHSFQEKADILWNTVIDVQSWPSIWKEFKEIKFAGNEETIKQKSIIHCKVKSLLPIIISFSVEIIEIENLNYIAIISRGDFVGSGKWILTEKETFTESSFEWRVRTTNSFINLINNLPFGRKLLEYNHNRIMKKGQNALIRKLKLQ